LGDDATLAGVLDKAGVPAAEVLAAVERQDIKDALRRNTDEAVSRGVFGAPTFFAGSEMFWGNDRLEFVEEALRKLA
jgi:2-hydroxychromene-2-carboxylate isomerase